MPLQQVEPLQMLQDLRAKIATAALSMPPRYVLFARRLAAGETQKQAAIDAEYGAASAASQGCRMAADERVQNLVALLQEYDIHTETHVSKASLKQVLGEVMWGSGVSPADRVAAVRVVSRMEGYDRVKVEVSGGAPAVDGDALRKELQDRLSRQIARKEA